ncbi:MAG: PHP domain-containing protein [Chlamydiae bacterium]|nr:PHP domain-containing protein [Chlamydiota bacterium]
MFRADLHCHTHFSDGTLSPTELILLAEQSGLSAISITDHDTIGAYQEAKGVAKKHNVILATGIEFSCKFEGLNIHLLGYDFSLESKKLLTFCELHEKRRKKRNELILKKLAQLKMAIAIEELEEMKRKKGALGRPHIANLMIKHGYVATFQEAFDRFIGDDKIAYVEGPVFSVEETIQIIHGAGGKAFLAHPHHIDHSGKINKLLEKPFDGIECYYNRSHPHEEQKWINIARERNLLISGGSDFHGSIRPNIPLGCSWVDEELFYKIFQNLN